MSFRKFFIQSGPRRREPFKIFFASLALLTVTGCDSTRMIGVTDAGASAAPTGKLPEAQKMKILITGSTTGLGLIAGQMLEEQGHKVVLHARNEKRAKEAKAEAPKTEAFVIGDVSTIAGMRSVAEQANKLGPFDAIIHNVGISDEEPREMTSDGFTKLYAVNVLAPYVLTALIKKPKRLIYISSGMHTAGSPKLDDPQWEKRSWNSSQAYSDTKLHDVMLANFVARKWPEVKVNSVDPGWVATRMNNYSAPGDAKEGSATQAWLAVSSDAAANVTGKYFHHKRQQNPHSDANNKEAQERLVKYLEQKTGVTIP
jgi:NAD(P)-dependent dehydrogenase (short-subunit alcohol dehydrogenase family)